MSVKAVIDTNVLVSSFLSKNPNSPTVRIANALLDGRFTPVYSRGMIDEYVDVLGRDYLNLQAEQVEELVGHLKASGEEVVPAESNENFPDHDDKVFFCTALADDAHLVTGNMKHYPPANFVVTPAQFCELLGI